jgi:PAS domain S-box-containing protein
VEGNPEQSRSFLQMVIDALPELVIIVDREYRVVLGNRRARELAGGKDPVTLGLTCHKLCHNRETPCDDIPCPMREVFANKAPARTTRSGRDADGREFFTDLIAAPIFDDEGEVVQVIEMSHDITERKQAEEALQESEARLRTAIESFPFDLFVLDKDGRYVMQNPTCREHWGDVIGKRPKDIITSKETLTLWEQDHRKALAGEVVRDEVTLNRDGEERSYANIISPIREGDDIRGILGVNIDITDQKRAEEALRESEMRYYALFSGAPVGIGLTTMDGEILACNDAILKITGYTQEEILHTNMREWYKDPRDRERLVSELQSNGFVRDFEVTQKRKDGTLFHANITATRLSIGAEDVILGIAQDITSRKQAEEEIAKLARFASENPNPVLRISRDGTLLYANAVSNPVLSAWKCEVGGRPSSKWRKFVKETFKEGQTRWIELDNDGQTFALTLAPVPDADYVNVYAIDITVRKEVERYQVLTQQLLAQMNQPYSLSDTLNAVTHKIKDFLGISAVGIRLRAGEDFPYFVNQGFPARFIKAENHLCARTSEGEIVRDESGQPYLECMCGNVLCGRFDSTKSFFTEGGSFWTNNTTDLLTTTTDENRGAHTRNRCNSSGYESVALIPIRADEKTVGLLQLNDTRRNCFTPLRIRFFEQIASSIAMSIKRHQAEEEIARLAKFPSENPNPVLRISQDGILLYANDASTAILNVWECEVGGCLPDEWRRFVTETFEQGQIRRTELERDGQTFALRFAPVVGADYVNIYAIDITDRKQAEHQIRDLNKDLERRIAARTIQLAEANKALLKRAEQLRDLAFELTHVEQVERRRLAHILHDHLQQLLVGAKMRLDSTLRCAKDENLRAAVKHADDLLNESIEVSRSLTVELSPPILHDGGLGPALEWLARRMQDEHGLTVEITTEEGANPAAENVRVLLFQSVRELLFNVVKHAKVKSATVEMTSPSDDRVRIVVADEGIGFDDTEVFVPRDAFTGFGLYSIRERLDLLRGQMAVSSTPGKGTQVTLTAPLQLSI